jgi:predicted permease
MRGIFGRRRRNAELEEEISGHFRLAVEDRMSRGATRAEAERAVRREFGNVLSVKEATREAWGGQWLEGVWRDAGYALRSLRRTPSFTVPAILTLALGVGANTAMYAVIRGVLLRPLPFASADRLVLVSYGPPPGPFLTTTGMRDAHYIELRANASMFEQVATFSNQPVSLTGVGEPVRLNGATVTPGFFELLGVSPVRGRTFAGGDEQAGRSAVVALGDAVWRSRFSADPGVVGSSIRLNGVPHTIVGILPAGFDFPNRAELWTPLEVRNDPNRSFARPVVARLRDDVKLEQANSWFGGLAARLEVTDRDDFRAQIQPLNAYLTARIRPTLLVFAGAVAFVLLIACANVANLLLMRGATRGQELAVRASLGAGRRRLIGQLITENLVVAALGGAAGILLAFIGVQALTALAPAGRIPRLESIHVDGAVLAFTLLVALFTGLLFGTLPALYATRSDLRTVLSQGTRVAGRERERLRSGLVVVEIALTLVLLGGAGLMLRSFDNMRAVELGFVPSNVYSMTVDLPVSDYGDVAAMHALYDRVLDGLAHRPAIEAAGVVNWMPMGAMSITGSLRVEGRPDGPGFTVTKLAVSENYFLAMRIPLLSGRTFSAADDEGAPGVLVISRSVAERLWPGQDALGRRLALSDRPSPGEWLTIVGVVDDVLQQDLTAPRAAAVYQPYGQVTRPFFLDHANFVVRSTAQPSMVRSALRDALRAADPNLPASSLMAMQETVDAATHGPRFQARLLLTFSLLALVLSAVGVYGVLAWAVTRRRAEIGIRMALGARSSDVARRILGRTCVLTFAGLLIGAAGALALTRVLEQFLFGVTPTDPLTFAAVTTLLCLTALLAGWLPARRAARVDPATALRAD